jgi:hypothetical protein
VVVIAEEIARERFGDPARSIDQRIETTWGSVEVRSGKGSHRLGNRILREAGVE